MSRSSYLPRIAMVMLLAMFAGACADDGETTANGGETGGATEPATVEQTTAPDAQTGAQTDAPTGAETQASAGDAEPLQLGTILPETGGLAYLAPPMTQAVAYAIELINEAGGVLGSELPPVVAGDEANDAAIANQSADRLLAEEVDAIIGAASSSMSLAILDKVTGAGVVECSGSNTAPTFTGYEDGGYYIRTAPTDALQGPVLAETIIADGHQNIVLLARADDYGRGLANAAETALTEAGASVTQVIYDTNTQNFDADVQRTLSENPDAVAVIAYDEGAQVIQGLLEGGITADQLYGTDGVRSTSLPGLVDPNNPNVLDGMTGTAPAPEIDEEFIQDFTEASGLEDTTFAPQKFDCVNIIALAAEAAGSTDPAVFKDELVSVTIDGTACTTFAECRDLLADGEDIDYNGASGPIDFVEGGEPGSGTYEIWRFENGALTSLDTVESTLPEAQS